jgi:hypothetical protein
MVSSLALANATPVPDVPPGVTPSPFSAGGHLAPGVELALALVVVGVGLVL